ncbi:vesicle-associated membrane protein 7 isoform X1 [Rhinolophus sinicus]|uniref:vesicle-associated membrane protein 7 isoform X1 n=1 Tax=Rhinolophus sinicus TaxID=89399 RepID=UPI003D790E66
MAILFAVVARGTTILAKHAWCGGNFLEVTEQILAKIPSENNKLTYSHGNYLFHYICQDRIIYLCITDDDFERSRAFNFLNEIKKRFQTTYGSRAQTALPYAMNSEFSSVLAAQLKHHSENKGLDKVMETQAQVDELKGIMVRNIDLVAQRGERLELLIDKTENLVDSALVSRICWPHQRSWEDLSILQQSLVCHLQNNQQKSCPSHVYEESQAHHHHHHRINCLHLYHRVTSLWWIYMAKLCEEIRKSYHQPKGTREHGVKGSL